MKPSWKDAPEWAQYLALDTLGGDWYWYQERPARYVKFWLPILGKYCFACKDNGRTVYEVLIEKRPES